MKKGMMKCCAGHKGKGFAMLLLGALVLGNVYWFMMSWPVFVGWIFVLAGVLKILMPDK
jgi:uncharacterized membrane protein HdeD (DUF308 family)